MKAALSLFTCAVVASLLTTSAISSAAKLRRPFSQSTGVNYGFDNNNGGACTDFACGGVCYDGHSGTDFPVGLGTEVVAAASGVVTSTNDGCANYGGLGNTCGGNCGNYVSIDHGDGTTTLYCHMQNGSVAVGNGQHVSCGQTIGHSASSGNSSGPHLHLGLKVNGGKRDPFSGSCSTGTSYWVDQGSYPHNIPSAQCEVSCECNPGEVQNEGCGNCGQRSRSCSSSCHWDGWGSCSGQGECAKGETQQKACCDCGSQNRDCDSSCHWTTWSACSGPDPEPSEKCDTGEPGPCAAGQERCINGCKKCQRSYEPKPEQCDDIDNDCSGEIDNGSPSKMGNPPPKLAARLTDLSHPSVLAPGSAASGWAVFRNEGSQTWTPGSLWLSAENPSHGKSSAFYDAKSWAAYNVASILSKEVLPGEEAILPFSLLADSSQLQSIKEDFRLISRDGSAIRCPNVVFSIEVSLDTRNSETSLPGKSAPDSSDSGGCSMTHGTAKTSIFLLLAIAALGLKRRR